MSLNIEDYLASHKKNIDVQLSQTLKTLQPDIPKMLYQAMSYSLLSSGKRLRPILAMAACQSVKGDVEKIGPLLCALEMIHAYSLVQDDLPCMDNDEFRRGQLTCHKVFGEGLALLASDALLTEAIHLVVRAEISKENRLRILEEILSASGAKGMVGGQVLDLSGDRAGMTEEELSVVHEMKTGALISASIRCGAFFGNASDSAVEALTHYGKALGLAYQIVDDILDATSNLKELGKNPKADERTGKKTFVSLLGVDGAKNRANECMKEGFKLLRSLGSAAQPLSEIGRMVLKRCSSTK